MPIIEVPITEDFSFKFTVRSHGWYDLLPFVLDEGTATLNYVFRGRAGERPVAAAISDAGAHLRVEVGEGKFDEGELISDVRHRLRLDDDITPFYRTAEKLGRVNWVVKRKAGRLLRSATVFEDLVKTICTTNCTWAVTRNMTTKLVEQLGEETACGRKAFPTAEAMAAQTPDFYREVIRAGYRSAYFSELAQAVASGEVDPESWLTSTLSTADLRKEMKKVKGVGDYAAENLLKLVGRYDGLALDSWLRAGFYKKHNNGKKCPDEKIRRHYSKFKTWQGLAIWCDMTEDWFTNIGRNPQ